MANLNPYLSFKNEARTAMEFYHSVLGGELTLSTFGEMPDSGVSAGEEELIMHAHLTTPSGLVLMASDTPSVMNYEKAQGISVSLSGDHVDEAMVRAAWDGLSAGAAIIMPLADAPWGGLFGQLVDRFGISWMFAVNPEFA